MQYCLFNLVLIESCGFAKITQGQISLALSVDNNWSRSDSHSSGFLCLNSWAFHDRSVDFNHYIVDLDSCINSVLSWWTEVSLASLFF